MSAVDITAHRPGTGAADAARPAGDIAGGPDTPRHAAFDGIQLADNPTPIWWHVALGFSILLGTLYVVVAAISPVYLSPVERLAAARAAEYERLFEGVGTLHPTPETLLTLMDDPKWGTVAAGMFRSNCASCHGPAGAGQVGPNLTDDHYKNVASIGDIYTVVAQGAGNGTMPPWSGRFSNNELVLLSAYVANLRGTSPAGLPKAPEGVRADPWPSRDSASADTSP